MSFVWNDYLVLAEKIYRSKTAPESLKRTAVSRAYYSMFHQCIKYANNYGYTPPPGRGGLHSDVPGWFRNQRGSLERQRTADKLRILRDAREECDYRDTVSNVDKILELALLTATEIKSLLGLKG